MKPRKITGRAISHYFSRAHLSHEIIVISNPLLAPKIETVSNVDLLKEIVLKMDAENHPNLRKGRGKNFRDLLKIRKLALGSEISSYEKRSRNLERKR